MENKPLTIELTEGHKDKEGKQHTTVEIGIPIKTNMFFLFEMFWGDSGQTMMNAYLLNAVITKFGELKIPVSIDALLDLDFIDFEDLVSGLTKYSEQNGVPEFIDLNTVKLIHGIEKDGILYDLVEFGKLTNGRDSVEAETLNLSKTRKKAFLAGKEIISLKQSRADNFLELEKGLTLAEISELHLIDTIGLLEQRKIWQTSKLVLTSTKNNSKN